MKETSFCCIFEIYQVKSKSFSRCFFLLLAARVRSSANPGASERCDRTTAETRSPGLLHRTRVQGDLESVHVAQPVAKADLKDKTCFKWQKRSFGRKLSRTPIFFLLHAAKVRSSYEEGPGRNALQSAYHDPKLDVTE